MASPDLASGTSRPLLWDRKWRDGGGEPSIEMLDADAQTDFFCFPPKGNEAQSGAQDFRASQASPPPPTCLASLVTKGHRAYLAWKVSRTPISAGAVARGDRLTLGMEQTSFPP